MENLEFALTPNKENYGDIEESSAAKLQNTKRQSLNQDSFDLETKSVLTGKVKNQEINLSEIEELESNEFAQFIQSENECSRRIQEKPFQKNGISSVEVPDLFKNNNLDQKFWKKNVKKLEEGNIFQELKEKQYKDQKKLGKWKTKISDKENSNPVSKDKSNKKNLEKPSLRQSSLDKYKHVESKVKQLIYPCEGSTQINCSQSMEKKRAQDLNTQKKQDQEQNRKDQQINHQISANNIEQEPKQKMEDQSIIQELIELDLSFMIKNINQKKEYLLNRMRQFSNQNISKEINNRVYDIRSGSIQKQSSMKKNQKTDMAVKNKKQKNDVEVIDLYQRKNSQKKKQSPSKSDNQINRLRSHSTNIKNCDAQKLNRQPGKIARRSQMLESQSIEQQETYLLYSLEEKYNSVIEYASQLKKQINNVRDKNIL